MNQTCACLASKTTKNDFSQGETTRKSFFMANPAPLAAKGSFFLCLIPIAEQLIAPCSIMHFYLFALLLNLPAFSFLGQINSIVLGSFFLQLLFPAVQSSHLLSARSLSNSLHCVEVKKPKTRHSKLKEVSFKVDCRSHCIELLILGLVLCWVHFTYQSV